jgi:N-methylhydantoinase B
VPPSDAIISRAGGGGGYGPPEERERDAVARDVREGKVSRTRAREVYGWQ